MLIPRLSLLLSLLRLAQTAHQLREPAGYELFRHGQSEDPLHDVVLASHPALLFWIGDGLPQELQLLPEPPALWRQPRRLAFDQFDEADTVHTPSPSSGPPSTLCGRTSENGAKAKFAENPF